jgi:CheY-like chemotaxis protein
LTISKSLVELMHGEISADSEEGIGSNFHFTAESGLSVAPTIGPDELPGVLNHLKVLVVDDNVAAREILVRYLQTFNFSFGEASSGENALRELEATSENDPYHLVLMDWKMSGSMDGIEAGRRIKQDSNLVTVPAIIIVSAYGREDLMQAAQESSLEGYLVKPVSASTLLDSIMRVFHISKEGDIRSTAVPAVAHTPEQICGAHLLLVEDNEINQQVAQELLKQGGISVSIASNGEDAVAAMQREVFDGVLMDIQMPVMNGFEATREIRKMEKFKNLPIIAMTANAMASDREAAIEAGMNDHIAKPIDPARMFAILGKWIEVPEARRLSPVSKQTEHLSPEIPDLPGIDIQAGLTHVGNNTKLYLDILQKFSVSQASVIEKIKGSMDRRELNTAVRHAHTLKGVAGNIGAGELQKAAQLMESALKAGEQVEELFVPLQESLETVLASVSRIERDELVAADSDSSTVDFDVLTALMAELKTLLEDDNADAVDVLDKIHLEVPGAFGSFGIDRLSGLVGDYDFEEALTLLEEINNNIIKSDQ